MFYFFFQAHPGPVVISGYEQGTRLAKNSSLGLNCTSCGGYPLPNITWTWGGQGSVVSTNLTVKEGCVTAALHLENFMHAVYEDKVGCVASNGLKLNSSAEIAIRLQLDGIAERIYRSYVA